MKTRLLMIIVVVATFTFPLVWFDQAYASCIAESEINWNAVLSESELVFTGTVTRLDNYDGPQKVIFFIHEVIKGEIDTPKYVLENTGMIFLENDTIRSSSVSVDYKIGKTYKVYVTNGETNQCTTKIAISPADYMWEPEPETREELVDRYAEIAEKNTDAMKTRESLQQGIDDELKKSSPDIEIIEQLKKEMNELTIIIQNTESELSSIQAKLSSGLQMDPKLKLKLEKARDTLRQNQKMIPWTGLGVSSSEQAVTISIDAENPEEYRKIIEDLVGKDIPVVIKKGGNPFLSNFKMPSPLKQIKTGTLFSEIKCNGNLQITQRYDGTPACVKDETIFELIKRGWTSDIIRLVQSRDIFLDPKDTSSSYMDRITPTLDDFKNILSEPYDIDEIFSKFGEPHKDIGSGIHIYVYELNDLTEIWIGYVDDIWYVKHVDVEGNELEELFTKNQENPENCPLSFNSRCFTGSVTEVVDGNTIQVNGGSVRLALLPAPDLDEEGGMEAKKFIEVLCPPGSEVLFDQDDLQPLDRYYGGVGVMGTPLGVVYCNGLNLNEELVESKYGQISTWFCENSEFGNNDWARNNGCLE